MIEKNIDKNFRNKRKNRGKSSVCLFIVLSLIFVLLLLGKCFILEWRGKGGGGVIMGVLLEFYLCRGWKNWVLDSGEVKMEYEELL